MSTSSSTPISIPTTCAETPSWRTAHGCPPFRTRYLMSAPEYRFFHPDGPAAKSVPRTEHEQKRLDGSRFVFEDSVIPVEVAGQIVQWSQDYRVSDALRLRAAEGHTPGSSVLWLDAGPQAVFAGDLTHSPIQLRRPADACEFDLDPIAAAVTRKRVLTEAAHTSRRHSRALPRPRRGDHPRERRSIRHR